MRRLCALCALFLLLLGSRVEAIGRGEKKHRECAIPAGVDGQPANYYAAQVPILIRNEETDQDFWAYAYGCVQNENNLEDDAWANLPVETTVSKASGTWIYQFAPDEASRREFLYDQFSAAGASFTAYVPTPDFRSDAEREATDHLVEPVSVPSSVRVGVTRDLSETLQTAGLIVDLCSSKNVPPSQSKPPDRVILLYSTYPTVRDHWTCPESELQPRKFISAWLNAVYLLCNVNRNENRAGDDEYRARTLMHRDPQYKSGWRLAEGPVDCSNPEQDGSPLHRKWGGGIAVYYLFPNLELGPLSVIYDGDYAVVTGTVINDSAATGDVSVLYKWTSDSNWQDNGTVAKIEPYQGVPHQGVTKGPASFTLRIKRPETPRVLSVFLWPRDNTPLAALHRDLSTGWAAFTEKYPEMLAHNEPWDEHYDARWVARWGDVWETELTPATHERQTKDNLRTILVQPGCDLSVQLTTPASTSQQGFDFQVHVTKTQCDLTQVTLEILVNGNRLPDQLTFAGASAYGEYHSGSLAGFDSALIEVRVDPGHLIRESDETNNIEQRLVPVERGTITCPSGVSPDECFRSKLNN